MKKKNKHAAMFLLISIYAFFFLPLTPLLAQTATKTNRRFPAIQHTPFNTALEWGEPVIVQININDNQNIREVLLFYRTQGKNNYNSIKMAWIRGGEYLTIIPQRFIDWPGIEYYIQATDTAGNTLTQGVPSAPLLITFRAPPGQTDLSRKTNAPVLPTGESGFRLSTASNTTERTVREGKPWYKKWWVWSIAIGVVAGAAAASSGSKGSGPGPASTGTGTVSAGIP